jgi:uncharacterized oxidoreductase
MRTSAAHLHSITRRIFIAAGTPPHVAGDVAEILVKANLAGHDSHGVLRIPQYLDGIAKGRIVPAAEPVVVKETASTMTVDGRQGFGLYTARWAMARAVEKARAAQVCCAGLTRIGHIGRLGEYAEQAARAGCIGLITTGDVAGEDGTVVPFGGRRGVLGTNPIAAGVPTGDGAPFLLDYATSMVAEGKIRVAQSRGGDLPDGCIIDRRGRPSVRPADFYDGGFLLPFGRHKGYALGVLVSLLGGLTGAFDVERGTVEGTFMQAIDVAAFTPLDAFQRGVRAALNEIKKVPAAPGTDEVLVPGEPERRARAQRLADGIEVPQTTVRQIQERARRLGVSLETGEVTDADRTPYRS